jgi:NEDD8-activating enzyme E1 regulatory subunit
MCSTVTEVMWQSIEMKDVFRSDVRYTFIIYTHPIDAKMLAFVEQYSQRQRIPVMFIHSAGFYSYFRIRLPGSFPIVDTHPDSTATTDLRLLTPWPELSTFAREMTAKIDELDAHTHGHIPYVVLLLHYLGEWKKNHAGKPPQTYVEKTAFRKMVAQGARTNNPEGGEENYDEAVAAVLKTITVPSLSGSVREVFDYNPDEVS